MIYRALSLLRQHHPYFRLHVDKIDDELWLVEEKIGDLPLTWIEGITENWQDELISLANRAYDHTVSLTFLQCRYNIHGQYQLFGVINHIALDGLGFVKALDTLYNYLGEVTLCDDYNAVIPRDRRPFVNVLIRNPIHQPPIFNFIHDYLPPQELDSTTNEIQSSASSTQGQIIGLFKRFDRATTLKLITSAKARSTTVQGMLSIAALITSIWIRKKRCQLPVWTLNWCATNLRRSAQPPIDSEDCVSASAPLAWEQEVKEESSLWDLARDASKQIHKHNSEHMGWHFLNAKKFGVSIKPSTVMTSSNGTAQLRTMYGKVKVKDLRAMTAHYNSVSIHDASHMNYISIYDEHVNLVTTFTHPGLSKEWGKRFHHGIICILQYFANDTSLTVHSILDILDKYDRQLHPNFISSTNRTDSIIFSSLRRLIALITRVPALSCCAVLSCFLLSAIVRRKFTDI
ncbi:hypothetical protein I4U23_011600 [Adineta vaga]|nr:hypothetical protein I4U23_011600 [Adineta vaga]